MGLEIRWTERAIESYNQVLAYLNENWPPSVTEKFIQNLKEKLELIQKGNVQFRYSPKLSVHQVLITKHNLLFYRVYPKRIDLVLFWDTRQNPVKKKV
ncbi:MAG: type II toxin-antitoxin system RelE/ParE family toxin [Bacteroidetes bacterium]|nr:MAG: type II toxin-antitoxin system RelE/ParE family toxin [Bacteroidota bacterium]